MRMCVCVRVPLCVCKEASNSPGICVLFMTHANIIHASLRKRHVLKMATATMRDGQMADMIAHSRSGKVVPRNGHGLWWLRSCMHNLEAALTPCAMSCCGETVQTALTCLQTWILHGSTHNAQGHPFVFQVWMCCPPYGNCTVASFAASQAK